MPDAFNFSDVFISYSRKDGAFARRLFDALKAEKREVWADWEDIPATADWWAEVQAGIEGANTFVFIISPDSVMSDVCRREIDHAMESNKRLIPVMYREVTDPAQQARMHNAISSHNWVYFRESDDFNTAYQRLIASIETDLNHVRMHTRLLVRAREWESRERIPGFLLTGTELREGRDWLAASAGKEPKPTPLHSEYILASSRYRQRQQILQIGLVVALVVAVALAVLSLGLFNEAHHQADVALNNAATATLAQGQALFQAGTAQAAGSTSDANALYAATQAKSALNNAATATIAQGDALNQAVTATLAQGQALQQAGTAVAAQLTSDANALYAATQASLAQSNAATAQFSNGVAHSVALAAQSQLDINGSVPERSLALALAAVQDFPYTVQAERALGIAVQNSRVTQVFYGHNGPVNSAAFSPDGTKLVTAGDDGTVIIWDVATAEALMTLSGHTDLVEDAVWSPDGKYIASSSADNTAILWDASTGEEIRQFSGHTDWVRRVAFSPDGKTLVTASDDMTARIWDVATGQTLHILSGHTDVVSDAVFSPDGKMIATSSWDNTAMIWDAATGQPIHVLGLENREAPGNSDTVVIVSTITDVAPPPTPSRPNNAGTPANTPAPVTGHTKPVESVDFSPDSRRLITSGDDAKAIIWDVANGKPVGTPLALRDRGLSAIWSANGHQLVTASADGTVTIWIPQQEDDPEQGSQDIGFIPALNFTASVVLSAAPSSDGTQVVTTSADGTVKLWNTNIDTDRLALDDTAEGHVIFSPDGAQILTISNNNSVRFWDAQSGEEDESQETTVQEGVIGEFVALSPDGTRLAVDTVSNGTEVFSADYSEYFVVDGYAPAWSPDGKRIVTVGTDKTAAIWDASDGTELLTLSGHTGEVNRAVWSPDGTRILTASHDETARVWDASTGNLLLTLSGHDDNVVDATYSPDGKYIVTASWDGTARVWDASSGDLLLTLKGHTGPVVSAVWSPNGKRILTASRDRTARVWDVATGEELLTLTSGGSDPLFNAAWSPDGTQIVTAAIDGHILLWNAWQSLDDLVAYAQQCCYLDQLTDAERTQFGIPAK